MSRVTRRISVTRSACSDGESPCSPSLSSTKASIGVRIQPAASPGTFGGFARAIGCSDHRLAGSMCAGFRTNPSGQSAPDSIHARIASTSAGRSGSASLGIAGLSPFCEVIISSR